MASLPVVLIVLFLSQKQLIYTGAIAMVAYYSFSPYYYLPAHKPVLPHQSAGRRRQGGSSTDPTHATLHWDTVPLQMLVWWERGLKLIISVIRDIFFGQQLLNSRVDFNERIK